MDGMTRYALKTDARTGKMLGFPIAAAAPKIPPGIDALCRQHKIEIGDNPSPISVKELDAHFAKYGITSIQKRMMVKSSLAQVGLLQQ
jgi:hypothetical protein